MLTAANTMKEYFREALGSALESSRVSLTEDAQVYLVHLLDEFVRSEKVYAGTDHGERPIFALMMKRAAEANPVEAVRIYKHLGDSSLYLTGFFADAVAREIVSRDYYVSVGESAYSSVADLARTSRFAQPDLFMELAERFADLVDLFEAMSLHGDKTAPQGMSDARLVQLIERYQRTGSKEVLQTLSAHGVVLRPGLQGDDESTDVH